MATTTAEEKTARPAARPIESIRDEFPILTRQINGKPLAYLDSGASAQRPAAVIEALDEYNRAHHANVHRGVHTLSEEATSMFEGGRRAVARHLAADPREIVFTRNATEAINLVAYSWGRANLAPGDRLLVTELEHHSNIVPWQLIAAETGAEIDWVPVRDDGSLDLESFDELLERGPKLVAVAHVSNVLGTLNPVAAMARSAREAGAAVLVDGAQAAPKLGLDMEAIGADFYAFTGHKAYGPTGVGVLWGRFELLAEMRPFNGGGSMIRKVTKTRSTYADPPARFEAGTPAIAEAIGLGVALDWMGSIGMESIEEHERQTTDYALHALAEVPGLRTFGLPPGPDRIGPVSFEIDGVHAHDVAEILDRDGIAVRAGHHCAQPLMQRLGVAATTRASFGVYTTTEEIDRLVTGLHEVRRIFGL
ncbi:MAG: cysteine desulfurase [Solirubrobacterales bacterium]